MQVDAGGVVHAINSDAIVPCFQPLIDLRTGALVGFEVLARWHHPQHGLVLPSNFIAEVENAGLIGQLTQQLLRKSFAAMAALPEYASLCISINISPAQLHDLTLPAQIKDLAAAAGFDTTRLIMEITETALVADLETARTVAAGLKKLGCRLALDDFGTGYSSLLHLHALPFDELKIDRSFISTMATRRHSRKIAGAVVGLGHSLGLTTVAEGIETQEQADMMLALGCELGQGWLFGKPVPAEDLLLTLSAARPKPSQGIVNRGSDWVVNSLEALPAQRLAQLQAIYNTAPVGLCFLDTNLRYVSLNRRLAEINGMPMEAHIGRRVRDIVPREYFDEVLLPNFKRALAGEAVKDVEITRPAPTPEGVPLTLLINYEPAFDEAHEVVGISVVIMDITERKLVENALRAIEGHYRNMIDLNPHILWIMDADGNVVDYGTRWQMLTGREPHSTLRWGWLDALHPDDRAPVAHHVQQSLATGRPMDIEYRLYTATGELRRMHSRGQASYDAQGNIMLWYGCLEDVEEYKRALDALRPQSSHAD